MQRILIVEDEDGLRRALSINLRARGYEVETAATAAAALRIAAGGRIDLVIVDLGLPDLDGGEVIAGIRGWSSVPIIVLSARDSQAEKVKALDAGADDYVTKPFGMDELLARIRAAQRRFEHGDANQAAIVETAAFRLDLAAKRAERDGAVVRLTPTEWQLVEVLVRHRGNLVSAAQLLSEVWGPGYEKETNYLRVYFAQLRRKLEPHPSQPIYFITEPGIGYRFEG
jgi:two-component system KDP operon response regulator KdpE